MERNLLRGCFNATKLADHDDDLLNAEGEQERQEVGLYSLLGEKKSRPIPMAIPLKPGTTCGDKAERNGTMPLLLPSRSAGWDPTVAQLLRRLGFTNAPATATTNFGIQSRNQPAERLDNGRGNRGQCP
jgi:hypothetical protein